MSLKIPSRGLGRWAQELVNDCSTSQKERAQRGALFRNLFLTGDPNGTPQTYPKTNPYVEQLSAFLYSPVDLRYTINADDPGQPNERAMALAASRVLHAELRAGGVDMKIDQVVTQSLIKGKSFLQILFSRRPNGTCRFEPSVLQPELMGVLREDLPSLDAQEAFFFSTYITYGRFAQLVENHPDRDDLLKSARKYMRPTDAATTSPDKANFLKQVIVGGLNPYRTSEQGASGNQGLVNWLSGPAPTFDPEVLASLIRIDELWVQDAEMSDWTTIQLMGDEVIEGKYIRRNIFSDPGDITDKEALKRSRDNNPLAGRIPFIEFCPNELEGYFWGRSELYNVSLIQLGLNQRIDGIQRLLRMQEDPPRSFSGNFTSNQATYAKLNKPGAFVTSDNPNAKVENLAPDLPADLWLDKHEYERMFDDVGGFTATMQGRGDANVRSQAQAETLVRTASPRFKTRALKIERSVENAGNLMLDVLRARYTRKVAGWTKPGEEPPNAAPQAWWRNFLQSPAPGMHRIEFLMHDLPAEYQVRVDSHSSSPAFSYESRELAFALANRGAINNPSLIALTQPAHAESLMMDAETAEIQRAQLIAQHPELLTGKKPGPKK